MTETSSLPPILRRARLEDASFIVDLYQRVYSGNYSDPMMGNAFELRGALLKSGYFWMVAEAQMDSQAKIVGSVVYRYDPQNALAKVYAAVVDPNYRGHALTERLMTFGYQELQKFSPPVEVVYATTRTVSPAPQKLTANLGYKKLGIFPNVHRTAGYETHCLTALFSPSALEKRHTEFSQHPSILPLFEIAAAECSLPLMEAVDPKLIQTIQAKHAASFVEIALEPIQAPEFVRHRFREELHVLNEHHWFFPFQEPNLLLSTPDQSVEVFCFFSDIDKHCVLIGARDIRNVGYTSILASASHLLHDMGARYLEFIMRADEIDNLDAALSAEFIPSAYFPAMHCKKKRRYDFVAFSRSFDILNFRILRLEGSIGNT